MPPGAHSLIARLAGLMGTSPEAHDDADAKPWGAAGAGPTSVERRPTDPLEEEEEHEGEGGAASAAEEQEQEGLAPLRLPKSPSGPSYFDDQGGRVMRGDSFATSLDTVAPTRLQQHKRGLSWMASLGAGPLPLEEFVELLPQILERCDTRHMRKCEPVKRLLERLALPKEEWARFAFWDSDKLYTRNLVATDNKTYTLLLLCWNPGKESPIHDHPCDGCWVKSLQGQVKETVYQMDPVEGLVPEQENFFNAGELSYIEDSLGYHKVGNPGSVGAVTLHLYCPPPKLAKIWLASKGTRPEDAMTVPTTLFSAFGKKLSENSQGGQGQQHQQPAGPAGSIMAPVLPAAAPGAGEVIGSPPKPGAEGFEKLAA